ncbi:MAG: polysaccharide deacetylase family protein [Oscillospiraceae bacterium]|nr:polysaccharide deacetylase family protein [Oscillospiraceae bacterium]
MKRLFSILMSLIMLLTLCACGTSVPNNPQATDIPTTPVTPPLPSTPAVQEPQKEPLSAPPLSDSAVIEESHVEQEEYVRTVDPSAPMVALTFDDGPHKVYSNQILDVLEEYHSVATFFEVGYNARLYPEILVRMDELGCEIANHSNTHRDLSKLGKRDLLLDLASLDDIVRDAIGTAPTLVRPPYGAVDKAVKYETGRAVITWTIDTLDWKYKDAEYVTSYVQNAGNLDGEIILLHSIHASTAEAMQTLVPWLIEQGYQLVTVSELMAYYYGELLEANHYYDQNYFARRDRTEYPLELPEEPMEVLIPELPPIPAAPIETPPVQPTPVPEETPAPAEPPVTETPVPDTPPIENPSPTPPAEVTPSTPPAENPSPTPPTENPATEIPPTDTPPVEIPPEAPPTEELPAEEGNPPSTPEVPTEIPSSTDIPTEEGNATTELPPPADALSDSNLPQSVN